MQQEEKILYENVPPPGKKKVAVIIGRFNPPTKGHYHLINTVKKYIKNNKKLDLEAMPVLVIIAGSKSDHDKSKNPLTGEERLKFMKASGKADGVKFLTAKTAFEALNVVRENDYEPIAIAGGEERAADYLRMLDKYFKDANGEDIKHHEIELPRKESATKGTEEDHTKILDKLKGGKTANIAEISASLARTAAKLGYLEEFSHLVDLEDKPVLAKKMFDIVVDAVKK